MAYQPRCPGAGRKFHQGGIQKTELIVPPVNSEPVSKRLTFAEAIDFGNLDLRVAAENYLPSNSKDITEDRLRACANAGLTQYEVAKGFGATQPTISYHAKKWRIKFDVPTPEKKAWAKKEAAEIMARVVAEDEPEPAGSIEADMMARKDAAEFERRKPAIVNEDFEAEFVKIDAEIAKEPPARVNLLEGVSAEQIASNIKQNNELFLQTGWVRGDGPAPANEYTLVFGRSEDVLPALVIRKDGTVCIKNCEMDMTLRYVVCFRSDFQGVKVADDKCGREFKPEGKQFQFTCGAISKAITAAGIELPAHYRLDIEEMTGVLL